MKAIIITSIICGTIIVLALSSQITDYLKSKNEDQKMDHTKRQNKEIDFRVGGNEDEEV